MGEFVARTEQNTKDAIKLDADTDTVTIRAMRDGKCIMGTYVTWEQLRKLYQEAKEKEKL